MKVSVKDELPLPFEDVFVYREGKPRVHGYQCGGEFFTRGGICPITLTNVTHWEKKGEPPSTNYLIYIIVGCLVCALGCCLLTALATMVGR